MSPGAVVYSRELLAAAEWYPVRSSIFVRYCVDVKSAAPKFLEKRRHQMETLD